MDLHTGTTVWQLLDGPNAAYPAIGEDVSCDVVVIGGGLSGAQVAAHLAREGREVIVLDRRQPLAGSSLACTALLQYELDQPLSKLRAIVGDRDADRSYRACYAALNHFPAFVASLPDHADLQSRTSLYLAGSAMGPAELAEEVAQRRRLGIECALIDGATLRKDFGVDRPAAILSRVSFELDPVRFTRACLNEAARLGTRVFGRTEAIRHDADDGGVTVTASDLDRPAAGPRRIRCRHVVYATGYEAPEFLGFHVAELNSTWAVASGPGAPAWPTNCLMWEASDPYCYVRTTRDGRIIVGGEDEPFQDPAARDALIPRKVEALKERFAEILPGHSPLEVATAWAGTFAQTPDGLPCIGEVPGFPAALFALGYGGNGVLFSFIAARLIGDLLAGRGNPLADLFGFGRLKIRETVEEATSGPLSPVLRGEG